MPKKKTYLVKVSETREAELEVEATDEEKAEKAALKLAKNGEADFDNDEEPVRDIVSVEEKEDEE